jgi:hypothetical protein
VVVVGGSCKAVVEVTVVVGLGFVAMTVVVVDVGAVVALIKPVVS